MTPRAVVRRPSPRLSEGLTTHIQPRPVDAGLALRQWQAYCDALRTAGWEVVEAPPADEHPDGVFVEDVAVAYGDTVVITRPGAPERAGEVEGMAELFSGLGRRVVDLPAGHGPVLVLGAPGTGRSTVVVEGVVRRIADGTLTIQAASVRAGTMPRWSRSSPCYKRTSSTANAGAPAPNSASRS